MGGVGKLQGSLGGVWSDLKNMLIGYAIGKNTATIRHLFIVVVSLHRIQPSSVGMAMFDFLLLSPWLA